MVGFAHERRSLRAGTIRVLRNQIFVSNRLHEDYVGLEEMGDGVFGLYHDQVKRNHEDTKKLLCLPSLLDCCVPAGCVQRATSELNISAIHVYTCSSNTHKSIPNTYTSIP